MTKILSANDIEKSFEDVSVLNGVNIDIYQKEIVSIMGKSGSGKSTLLHILGTLDQADKGQLKIANQEINQLSSNQLADFRNNEIGFVFQFHHLLAEFTALENVSIPAYINGINKKEAEYKALELMRYLSVDHRLEHRPSELSGGEQQRVAIARALINDPKIIFADEPTGNLDGDNAHDIMTMFRKLRDDFNQTFVIVTHDQELANTCDRCLRMQDGIIIES